MFSSAAPEFSAQGGAGGTLWGPARSCFRWKLHPSSEAWPLLSTSNRGETAIDKCGNLRSHSMFSPACMGATYDSTRMSRRKRIPPPPLIPPQTQTQTQTPHLPPPPPLPHPTFTLREPTHGSLPNPGLVKVQEWSVASTWPRIQGRPRNPCWTQSPDSSST